MLDVRRVCLVRETKYTELMGARERADGGVQGPNMAQEQFPTAFPLKHQRKDMELALRCANSKGQYVPVAAATTKLFKKVETSSA